MGRSLDFCSTMQEAELKDRYALTHCAPHSVIKLTHFGGKKQYSSMVMLRDFSIIMHCLSC